MDLEVSEVSHFKEAPSVSGITKGHSVSVLKERKTQPCQKKQNVSSKRRVSQRGKESGKQRVSNLKRKGVLSKGNHAKRRRKTRCHKMMIT